MEQLANLKCFDHEEEASSSIDSSDLNKANCGSSSYSSNEFEFSTASTSPSINGSPCLNH